LFGAWNVFAIWCLRFEIYVSGIGSMDEERLKISDFIPVELENVES